MVAARIGIALVCGWLMVIHTYYTFCYYLCYFLLSLPLSLTVAHVEVPTKLLTYLLFAVFRRRLRQTRWRCSSVARRPPTWAASARRQALMMDLRPPATTYLTHRRRLRRRHPRAVSSARLPIAGRRPSGAAWRRRRPARVVRTRRIRWTARRRGRRPGERGATSGLRAAKKRRPRRSPLCSVCSPCETCSVIQSIFVFIIWLSACNH